MSGARDKKLNIEILPKGVENPRFQQRESGIVHTPYRLEIAFYNLIKSGDVEGVHGAIGRFMENALVVGRMSNDALRQAQYFAVSCITLATRYAVEGGLMEGEAYNLSDSYIQTIDKMNDVADILQYLVEKAIEITSLVSANKKKARVSVLHSQGDEVRKCASSRTHKMRRRCSGVRSQRGLSFVRIQKKRRRKPFKVRYERKTRREQNASCKGLRVRRDRLLSGILLANALYRVLQKRVRNDAEKICKNQYADLKTKRNNFAQNCQIVSLVV